MQQTDHVVKRKKKKSWLVFISQLFIQSIWLWPLSLIFNVSSTSIPPNPYHSDPFQSIPFLPILRSCLGLSFISFFNVIPIHHTLLIMSCLLVSSVYVSLYWQNVLLFQNYHSRGILNYMRGRPDKAVSDLKVCDVIFTKSRWMNRTMLIMRDALK